MKQQHKNFEVTRKHAATPLGFKFSVGDAGEIEGYGSIFGNVDSAGERVVAGAFSASLAKHKQDGTAPLMLWQHRESEPIGRWTNVLQDSLGLKLIGKFNLETSRGRDAYEHVKQGDLAGLSIGYRANKVRAAGDVLDLLEIDLFEVSVVSFPSNPKARVTGVKCESAADVERVLREGGLSRVAALRIAAGGWRALSPQSNQIVKSFADRVSRATDELSTLKGKL